MCLQYTFDEHDTKPFVGRCEKLQNLTLPCFDFTCLARFSLFKQALFSLALLEIKMTSTEFVDHCKSQ